MAQPKYLQAIKEKLTPKTPYAKKEFIPAYPTWKPEIGKTYKVRFVQPVDNVTDEPFYEILFYRNLEPNKRFVAPYQFNLPDPIKEEYDAIRRDNWNIAKNLKAGETYFSLLLDRANEAAGIQVFEFSKEIRDQIYNALQSEDYQDKDVFDPENGFDFEIKVFPKTDNSGKPKLWNGKQVRGYSFQIRINPSPLAKTAEERERLLSSIPRILEIQKGFVKSPENLRKVLDAFYEAKNMEMNSAEPQAVTEVLSEGVVIESEEEKIQKFSSPSTTTTAAIAKLNALKAKAGLKKDVTV
jgi:hypothetical protein